MTNTELEWSEEDEAQLRQDCRRDLAEILRDADALYEMTGCAEGNHAQRIDSLLWNIHYLREDLLAWATAAD